MKISFIVTCFNHEKFILESLQSIEDQSLIVDELVIADDASTDGTVDKVKVFIASSKIPNIKFIENAVNMGVVGNFNQAIKAGTGDILILQAGDDLSTVNRVKVTVEKLSESSEKNALYSSYTMIDENSAQIKNKTRSGEYTDPLKFVRKGSSIPPFGMAVRRVIVESMPEPPKNIKNDDDFFGMYLLLNGGIIVTREILYKYRVHRSSLSSWSNASIDSSTYVNLFLSDQHNRINNFKAWNNLVDNKLIKSVATNDEINLSNINNLINKKIEIKKHIIEIKNNNIIQRLNILFKYFYIINIQELIIFLFGTKGILLYRYLRGIF